MSKLKLYAYRKRLLKQFQKKKKFVFAAPFAAQRRQMSNIFTFQGAMALKKGQTMALCSSGCTKVFRCVEERYYEK